MRWKRRKRRVTDAQLIVATERVARALEDLIDQLRIEAEKAEDDDRAD